MMRATATAQAGQVVSGRTLAPRFTASADVIVVGTGAGGAMAARELAAAGLRVIAVERGSFLQPHQMTQREDEMMPRLFLQAGMRTTDDLGINVLQGQGVGGSTLHNTNLCKPIPAPILDHWRGGLGLTLPNLEDDQTTVATELGVHRIPDDRVNENNAVLARGRDALGWAGGRLSHNRDEGCRQSGFCELGCAFNGKRNAAKLLIPQALANDALVISDARIDQIRTRDGVVIGVAGRLLDPVHGRSVGELVLDAPHVVLAGSATGSAALYLRSRLPDPHRLAGAGLRMHPGAVVVGMHNERIEGWRGIPQSEQITEFLQLTPDAQQRVWILSGFAHPAMAATQLPGFGPEHSTLMRQYAHCSVALAVVHDHTAGHVLAGDHDDLRIRYTPDASDRAQLVLGLQKAAHALLAGGAERVLVPLHPTRWVTDPAQLNDLSVADIDVGSPGLTAVHPMGTLRMGTSPRTGVVDEDGHCWHTRGLWVADGSLFPTSIGGPPQIGIYTMGMRVARALVARR